GGRYSALSVFGLVPAALHGVDLGGLLERATAMADACRRPATRNPGLRLGAFMGEAARGGRDKLTVLTSPRLAAFGDWAEQLIAFAEHGALPESAPIVAEPGLSAYADVRVLGDAPVSVDGAVRQLLDLVGDGDYFAILAYLPRDPDLEARLQGVRRRLRDALGVATTLGFGPRFLHSTGQLHKGGPPSGVFLQITAD